MVTVVYVFLSLANLVIAGQQYFRQRPQNIKIQEGGEAVLECEISMLQGSVQWTKDGFALGFSAEIPGFPRYSYVGDRKNGVYNLKITNASLEDDAEYQCQVGPAKNSKAIRANANLTVIAPPSSIEIVGHTSNSKIEIKENQDLEIECLVKNSKPPAKIVWYKGDTEVMSGRSPDVVTKIHDKKVVRYNVLGKLKIRPTSEDDFAQYSCEARHEALPHDMPLRATVHLSVLYPPGHPYIQGYTDGEIRKGEVVELICRSHGGNPPAQLIWYKNGEQIRMAYRTSERVSENIYKFTADASDNKAKYKCEASNIMSTAPLKAEITMSVLFAPARVTISGATEAKAGEKVSLTCTTEKSNPPAEIKWLVGGRQWRNTTFVSVPSPDGGSITTSNITVLVPQNKRSLVVICHGLNLRLTENIVNTHTINVLYPPGSPIISGYQEGKPIPAGTVQEISCISSGGNPLATLTWYKNDKKINSVAEVSDRSVSAKITVYTNVTDNGAIYKCEASNSATEVPAIETVKLNVYFAPDHVRIRKEPVELKPGQVATLTCESSSSNPPARLSWWKEGIPIDGATNSSKAGLHGGVISSIELKVNVTHEMSGVVYTCQATNEELKRSVHDAFTLDVLYKPVFGKSSDSYVGVEGDPLIVQLDARGNPSNIAYTWSKDGIPLTKKNSRTLADGPALNITKLIKNDTGVYTCEASNSEGSSSASINITVNYSPRIVDFSKVVTVDPEEKAELYCRVEGNPLKEDHVTWKSKTLKESDIKTNKSFQNSTSYLTIQSPKREDAGAFQCIANNGVGNSTQKTINLLIKYKPEMDRVPSITKAATNLGDTGKLICRTSAVPKPTFKWFREGSSISNNSSGKYSVEYRELNLTSFESVLSISNVENSDYGKYECEVRNEKGFASSTVVLDVTSKPDPPLSLTVLNVTHDAVTLSWVPGFDGGSKTSYRIRYKATHSDSSEGFRYLDVIAENVTTFVVGNLDLDTEYAFSIMAFNKLGSSSYLMDDIKAKTSSVVLPEELLGKADVPRIVIISVSITGAVLLLFNVLLVVCFVFRKKNKQINKGPSEQGSNKSATIEMYAPSSYNETVTGETLSSVSEKSENYSNGEANEEYVEDGRKIAASTYLIDQIDYPFQYPATYEMQHQLKANHTVPDPEIVPARNTLPHNPNSKGNYIGNSIMPPHTIDGSYYSMQPDARYVPYPPTLDYNHTMPTGNGSLRRQRGPVPPDVTVLHNPPPVHNGPVISATLMPQPALSTFGQVGYSPNIENEGHLV